MILHFYLWGLEEKMHKSKEFNKRYGLSGYIEEDEHKKLCSIAEREVKSVSAVTRKAVQDYIKIHAAGNDSYTLNMWNDNIGFMALPALLESQSKWIKYIQDEVDQKALREIQRQVKFLDQQIRSRLAQWEEDPSEIKRINRRKLEKFIKSNDIRLKDPKTLSLTDQIRRKQLLEHEKENFGETILDRIEREKSNES